MIIAFAFFVQFNYSFFKCLSVFDFAHVDLIFDMLAIMRLQYLIFGSFAANLSHFLAYHLISNTHFRFDNTPPDEILV